MNFSALDAPETDGIAFSAGRIQAGSGSASPAFR
jgi:hypothetical protein